MKPVVLISTDDDILSGFLEYVLLTENCGVRLANSPEETLRLAVEELPRLILVDCRSQPPIGIELCTRLRLNADGRSVAVLALADSNAGTAEHLLAADVDECIASPVVPAQLMTRIRVLLSNAKAGRGLQRLKHADIEMDMATHRVHRSGQPVKLGLKEFRLLHILLEQPGRVFSRDELVAGAWSNTVHLGSRTVDVHVGRLRKALNACSANDPIRTVRSVGYALADDIDDNT